MGWGLLGRLQIARLLLIFYFPFFILSCASTIRDPNALVIVKDVPIPKGEPWISHFAKHTYIDYRPDKNSDWRRIEWVNPRSGIQHYYMGPEELDETRRWGEPVRIIAQSDPSSVNPGFAAQILAYARAHENDPYRVWPGPNSNTFAENLIREIPGVQASLDHNAIGKEHGFYAGRTAAGTGIELQSPLLGAALGLHEGLELNLLGLTTGFSISPPALKIPFLPRIPDNRPRPAPAAQKSSPALVFGPFPAEKSAESQRRRLLK